MGIGILAGLALSFALNRVIAQWIENGTRDPMLVLLVSVILVCVAALACLIPARRALAIDPCDSRALRVTLVSQAFTYSLSLLAFCYACRMPNVSLKDCWMRPQV